MAVKVCELPNSSEAVAGVTVMLMEVGGGGVGGGTAEVVTLPPQPAMHAAEANSMRIGSAVDRNGKFTQEALFAFCERDHT
jgi:hypothetical protein